MSADSLVTNSINSEKSEFMRSEEALMNANFFYSVRISAEKRRKSENTQLRSLYLFEFHS